LRLHPIIPDVDVTRDVISSVKHTMFDVVIHGVFCSARRFAVSVGRVDCIHPNIEEAGFAYLVMCMDVLRLRHRTL
jgi:hypothetical protein